jgi:hypothetical protein
VSCFAGFRKSRVLILSPNGRCLPIIELARGGEEMRRFLALAIVMALGVWALKRTTQVGEDEVGSKGLPLSSDEETDPRSHPPEESVPNPPETQGPLDLHVARKHRRRRSSAGDDWSLPVGPNGEAKLRRTRTTVDERFRNLSRSRQREDGTAA